jgi:hypothetical protein
MSGHSETFGNYISGQINDEKQSGQADYDTEDIFPFLCHIKNPEILGIPSVYPANMQISRRNSVEARQLPCVTDQKFKL